MATVTVPISITVPTHGTFFTDSLGLDAVMAKYLPASPNSLRETVEERSGIDYSNVGDVSVFLIILASFDYPA